MKIVNRKASFDYFLYERLECGISLTGAEVRQVAAGKIKLDESYVKIIDEELYLVNALIPPNQYSDNRTYDPQRNRKLLIHKNEVASLIGKTAAGFALVATAVYNKGRRIKVEIALAKGKKKWDKREAIKKRDLEMEMIVST